MMTENKKNKIFKKSINIIAIFIIFIALTASYIIPDNNLISSMQKVFPKADNFNKISTNPLTFEVIKNVQNEKKDKIGYVVIADANGYGGPVKMVTAINMQGKIIKTIIAEHKDTPSFIYKIKNNNFLQQFVGKNISAPLSINEDIDSISGATLSSNGISKAISKGSHYVATTQFNINISQKKQIIQFGIKEIIVLALLILMLISVKFKIRQLRWVTLIVSLIFIGFKFNIAITLGNIASILMGYFPPINEYIYWYLWFLGIPVITFIIAKNVYCVWLCPFGAIQEIAAKIGGSNFKCNKKIDLKVRKLRYILTFLALLLAFIYKAPGLASYEPFATLFALNAYGIQWFILPLVICSSFFISRFWCRYFCPVGVVNEITVKIRKLLDSKIEEALQWKRKKSVIEK
jgi:Na+-translocating ferredoxin:NAD+ oxidoreductase RnfG subunit